MEGKLPAPEPQCACLDFWTTHHPECPRVLAGLEKAGVPAPEPEKLRRMAAEFEDEAIDTNCCPLCLGCGAQFQPRLVRLLERVVRECVQPRPAPGEPEGGQVMPDYKKILLDLIGSLTLCDHMGDVATNVDEVLKRAGIDAEDVEWEGLGDYLAQNFGATTLLGTSLLQEAPKEE